MTTLRNAPHIRWETAFTLERSINFVEDIDSEQELFIDTQENEDSLKLFELMLLAKRQIVSAWTGTPVTSADQRWLDTILGTCSLSLDINGAPVVRTAHIGDLSGFHQGGRDSFLMHRLIWAVEDGICEWMLRGRTRDVRSCLWDGELFRADRVNAVFDRASCRTAYHRALKTAESSNQDMDLLGFFRCVECERELLIDAASGLCRNKYSEDDLDVYIGSIHPPSGKGPICLSCAEKLYPEWNQYIGPLESVA